MRHHFRTLHTGKKSWTHCYCCPIWLNYICICGQNYMTDFLQELSKKDILKELELSLLEADEHLFDVLKNFKTLQLLILRITFLNRMYILPPSLIWPANLKKLRLSNFFFTYDGFISMMLQLTCLEHFDLSDSHFHKDQPNFKDVKKLGNNPIKYDAWR